VRDRVELATVLREVMVYLQRPDADLGWGHSPYESPSDLLAEVELLTARLDLAVEVTEDDVLALRLLFAPTGALQEASIATGWGEEFLVLAARADAAVGHP
jgi:hypothetical protein